MEGTEIVWYEYRGPGHIRTNILSWRKQKKDKAMMVRSWSSSKISSSDKEEDKSQETKETYGKALMCMIEVEETKADKTTTEVVIFCNSCYKELMMLLKNCFLNIKFLLRNTLGNVHRKHTQYV